MCRDEETFLSADDLRVNVWNLAMSDQSFNIVDMKPSNMEELTEVITYASQRAAPLVGSQSQIHSPNRRM